MKNALILDYKIGNVSSVRNFLRENGYSVEFGCEPQQVKDFDLLVLPGVGSFHVASDSLKSTNLKQVIKERHENNKPILGICLGFQMLTNSSSESPNLNGLGIFNGTTERLKEFSQIGWGKLISSHNISNLDEEYFYFNHSYGSYNIKNLNVKSQSGTSKYLSMAISEKTVGVQFHPERSQQAGSKFLKWLEVEVWRFND